jgi:hypothetical protein
MTEYKVTIGVKEIKVEAESEGDAASRAMARLSDNVAWVRAEKDEPRRTGFRYEPRPPAEVDESAATDGTVACVSDVVHPAS